MPSTATSSCPGGGIGLPGRAVPGGGFLRLHRSGRRRLATPAAISLSRTRARPKTHGPQRAARMGRSAANAVSSHHRLQEVREAAVHRRGLGADQSARELRGRGCYELHAGAAAQRQARSDCAGWRASTISTSTIDSDNGLKAPVNSIVGTFARPWTSAWSSKLQDRLLQPLRPARIRLHGQADRHRRARALFAKKKDFDTLIGVFPVERQFHRQQGHAPERARSAKAHPSSGDRNVRYAVGGQGAARLARRTTRCCCMRA